LSFDIANRNDVDGLLRMMVPARVLAAAGAEPGMLPVIVEKFPPFETIAKWAFQLAFSGLYARF
jgi:hypothetical protein